MEENIFEVSKSSSYWCGQKGSHMLHTRRGGSRVWERESSTIVCKHSVLKYLGQITGGGGTWF